MARPQFNIKAVMINVLKERYLGLIFAAILALISHFVGPLIPHLNGVIFAFLIAVLLGNFIKIPASFNEGIKFSSGTVLELAIIFMAFSINFQDVANLGLNKFIFLAGLIVLILILTVVLAKFFKSIDSTNWLVGFGTAICGSSAIAAVAPMVSKNKEDIGIAMAVVNLLGSLGMISLPFLLSVFLHDNKDVGFVLGASLQSVGNVAGAGAALGEEVKEAAIIVKLTRVALLTPAVILFTYLIRKQEGAFSKEKVSFTLPYYLWIFVAIALINSFIEMPENIAAYLKLTGTILLTISMAAIGLKVSFNKLWESGKMAVGFGLVIFVIQILFSTVYILLS